MTHRFAALLAIASLTFLAPRPAAAAVTHTFDTVDSVELANPGNGSQSNLVIVRGILSGQTTPTTVTFSFYNYPDQARECARMALIAMSKPGKYGYAIGASINTAGTSSCKLIRLNP